MASTRSRMMQVEGSSKTSLVYILLSWAKSLRVNPHLPGLLIKTVEMVEGLQSTAQCLASLLSLWALREAYWEADWSGGKGGYWP